MATLLSKSIYGTVARVVLLGLMAFCGASSPAVGQETVAGEVKLAGRKRVGHKIVPAGAPALSVAPVGFVEYLGAVPGAWAQAVVVGGPGSKEGRVEGM